MPFARESAECYARVDMMLKPHPPLSRFRRSGQAARPCGVVWMGGEGSAGLGLKLIPDGREILRRSA